MTLTFLTATTLAAAAGAESESELGAYIAGGIAAAVFLVSAIVLRSFRDVSHRSAAGDVHGSDHA